MLSCILVLYFASHSPSHFVLALEDATGACLPSAVRDSDMPHNLTGSAATSVSSRQHYTVRSMNILLTLSRGAKKVTLSQITVRLQTDK